MLDSLDVGELLVFIRTHYPHVEVGDIASIKTVGDLIQKIHPHV